MFVDQYCDECGTLIVEEDYIEDYDIEEYWGAKVRRYYTKGYVCHECGHEELY